jgi:hypothetical protein
LLPRVYHLSVQSFWEDAELRTIAVLGETSQMLNLLKPKKRKERVMGVNLEETQEQKGKKVITDVASRSYAAVQVCTTEALIIRGAILSTERARTKMEEYHPGKTGGA